ncbi:UNVERIFIED_CONTAM: GABA transporter 1 [Sesamum radiatum]|uniref:GABA transporter 1 n=1 Tax=Sesamum radiatum TaxID=300843 RepID=A0AAW2UMN7_SESRA
MGSGRPSSTELNGGDDAKAPPPAAAAAPLHKELDAGAQFVLKSRGQSIKHTHIEREIMDTLWVPLDNIDRSSSTVESAICICITGMDGWSCKPGDGCSGHLLLIQLALSGAGTPCSIRSSLPQISRHGHSYSRSKVGCILRGANSIPGVLRCSSWLYSSGGQCMKAIYLVSSPEGNMKLYEFVIIFGGLMLILAQIPSFHSLRHINLVSLFLCLAYSSCATAASIYIGSSSKGPRKDYSLNSNSETRIFGFFNALAIIATTFGNGIIPEIQATLAPPVKGKMLKGLCICYAVVTATFFSVAISGYWAFGNGADGLVLTNFLGEGEPLVPKWFILMTNAFTILQLSAVAVVYLQPTNEVLERTFADPKSGEFSARNVVPRVISRSLSVIIATTIAAMLPFFGDINAVIGAFGFMPLDFVLPVVFFNLTFKPSKKGFIFWLNTIIAVVFSVLGVIAAVAAVRQISLDAKTYRLFANI